MPKYGQLGGKNDRKQDMKNSCKLEEKSNTERIKEKVKRRRKLAKMGRTKNDRQTESKKGRL